MYKLHVLMEGCKLKVKQEADERKKRYIAVEIRVLTLLYVPPTHL